MTNLLRELSILAWAFMFFTSIDADDSSTLLATHLECDAIRESSGIALSYQHPGVLWTHNDSGNANYIFAFDRNGKHRQEIEIQGAENEDWEDIASYPLNGKSSLLIGDVGDNARRRDYVTLYRLDEPKLNTKRAEVDQTWIVQYPDGPQNCEAIAVDVRRKCALLATKTLKMPAHIYAVPLDSDKEKTTVTATFVGAVNIPMITGMDVHPVDGRIIIVTYANAFIFHPSVSDLNEIDWQATFASEPQEITLPFRRQGEAVCFDSDGQSIWLTSEKHPGSLMHVRLPPQKESDDQLRSRTQISR